MNAGLVTKPLAAATIALGSAALLGACSGAPTSTGWGEADQYVGEELRICGPIASVGQSGGDTFINVGRDYPDPDRFTIVLWSTAPDQVNRPGSGGGSQPMEDESHGSTQEVPRRAA